MEYGAKRHSSIRWYLFGILVALELLMSFSFLGYFHAEPISITIAYIPVLLAGALLGPLESMAVGTVFGLASMWKASASYVMPFDRLFSPIMSGYPVESFLLSVGSRALFGLLIGVLYMAAKKGRPSGVWMGVVSFFGQTIHSALVYGTMWIFFPEAGLTLLNTVESFFTLNNIVANLLSAGLVVLFWHIMRSPTWNQFVQRLEAAKTVQASDRLNILPLVGIILLAIISSVAVALYFVQRMVSVLQQKGVTLPDDGYDDMVHLQIQFLFGILAMMVLVTIFLVLNRRYNTYMRREF